ncbi:LexA/Signal peptidase [Polychaeton citri CBS 116435]|uniref:Mitochondrial inner membrane protease subunit n=1 Tax=Polychaeton citri CBS 116435 TaxID=1314669 RepID=A0A9P4QDM9_9PEZI|nr:LexA/Signal peptidase [Polychaeton citri CBS 116435]
MVSTSALPLFFLRKTAKTILWLTPLGIFVNDYSLETTTINGASMSPTLSPNYHETGQRDLVLWNKNQPTRDLKRGDIVNFMAPYRPEGNAVKRVIALPGDTVLLDPRRRPHESRDDMASGQLWDSWEGRVTVPWGHVWVEGDNRHYSMDSNTYGPISKSLIVGRAQSIVLPLSRLGSKPWEDASVSRSRTRVVRGRPMIPEEFADIIDPRSLAVG